MKIRYPIFEDGFDHTTGHLREKGILRDPETGKRYVITGRACGLGCRCDAWADEVESKGLTAN